MSIQTTEAQQGTIDRVERDLLSGRYFTLIEQSNRSVPLGGGPISHRSYADAMTAVARFASHSDWAASVAQPALRAANLYATPNEVVAQVAGSLAVSVRDGYYDVVSATGPEPSRPSAHQQPTTLRRAIAVALLLIEVQHAIGGGHLGSVPTVGWVLARLMERDNIPIDLRLFPLTHANFYRGAR